MLIDLKGVGFKGCSGERRFENGLHMQRVGLIAGKVFQEDSSDRWVTIVRGLSDDEDYYASLFC